jgi:hypothetical protein
MSLKIEFEHASQEARTEIAKFIRERAAHQRSQRAIYRNKRDLDKINAIAVEFDWLANAIEKGEL